MAKVKQGGARVGGARQANRAGLADRELALIAKIGGQTGLEDDSTSTPYPYDHVEKHWVIHRPLVETPG